MTCTIYVDSILWRVLFSTTVQMPKIETDRPAFQSKYTKVRSCFHLFFNFYLLLQNIMLIYHSLHFRINLLSKFYQHGYIFNIHYLIYPFSCKWVRSWFPFPPYTFHLVGTFHFLPCNMVWYFSKYRSASLAAYMHLCTLVCLLS